MVSMLNVIAVHKVFWIWSADTTLLGLVTASVLLFISFKCINNANLSETINDNFRLLRKEVHCSYEPVSSVRCQYGYTSVNFHIWNGSSTGYLLLNLLCIPGLKVLLHWLVNWKIEGLQLVSAIRGHINMVNVVLLKKLMKAGNVRKCPWESFAGPKRHHKLLRARRRWMIWVKRIWLLSWNCAFTAFASSQLKSAARMIATVSTHWLEGSRINRTVALSFIACFHKPRYRTSISS